MKNRASAQDSRNRKRAYLSALESQNALLRQQNSTLVSRVSALESQNAALATQLAALQPLLDFVAIQTGPEPAALPSPQRTRFFPALSSLQLSLLAENWRVLRTWMLLCERISILAALSLGRRISMVPTSRGVGSRYKSLSLGKGCGWEVAMARR